jgi:hypothetical protein
LHAQKYYFRLNFNNEIHIFSHELASVDKTL